jgi:hypothetical protein
MAGLQLIPRVTVNAFFDRAAVKNSLTKAEFHAFSRAGLLVRRTAKESIKRRGLARPMLKVMKTYPGLDLSTLARLQDGPRSSGGFIRKQDRKKVIERIREIKTRPPSAPGTPPHTHVTNKHMLGFRRNLYNAYDKSSHSAVVGPSKKGSEWTIPQLHEFGGAKKLKGYVWKPKYARYTKPIIRWVSEREDPGPNWAPLNQTRTVAYPPRPFMRPALAKCRGRIAALFRNTLRP